MYNFGETTCAIKAEKIFYIPSDFIVITEQDMDNHSLLRKAVETEEIVKEFCRKTNKIFNFLNGKQFFKYEENYYEIKFYSA